MDSDPDCSCDDFHSCRPALPRIKSCLKSSPSHSGASTPSSDGSASFGSKKHVAFCEDGTEEVYEADEWDRTPAEIQRLSYDDVLELKMLQRELPRAAQPIDALSSKPFANVFLSHVPIPLLPLNPTTVCASQSTPPNMTSPPLPRTTTPARNRNPPLLRSPASSICSSPPPIEYRRSPPKSLPDQHVIRPHNIPVPPPPVPLRRTYPPAPSTTQTHPKIKSNLPPKRTFSFVPLLDDSSHCRPSLTPTSSTTTTPSGGASPVFGSALLSGTPEPPPLTTLSASASSASLSASSSHSSSCSDPDRSDQGYVSDCSMTEVSTPSLTTASLASSSPPDSPGLEHDFFYEHGERGGARRASRSGPDDGDDIERFVLNLDMDADVDHVDSYFARVPRHPPPSLAMHPIHADAQKDEVADVAPPSSLSFVSRAPISPFHARHPHLNRSTFARSPTNKMNGNHINRTGSAGYEDAANDNGGCGFSVFDPLNKLRLHAVPSPGLDAPSPLELPPGTATIKGPAAAGGLRKIRMGLVPLAEPAPCYQDDGWRGTLFGADEGVIPPSLSRS